MIIKTIENKYVCDNCHWEWMGRKGIPKICPECKSQKWNITETVQDLTRDIEDIKLELEDTATIKRFEVDYGFPLESYMRTNK